MAELSELNCLLLAIGLFLTWWASGLAAVRWQMRTGRVPSDLETLLLLGSLAALIGPFAWWAGRT